jgi:glycosyltransferase involved in cell wall biosynthesis
MKITFLVNNPSRHPFGGYKIIYLYANKLINNGHKVNILYHYDNPFNNYKMPNILRTFLCYILVKIGPTWFKLSPKVKQKCIKQVDDNTIPDADAIIATAVDTPQLIRYLSTYKGKKFYFIQHFENWVYDDQKVLDTYNLGFTNIVIAKWLKNIVDEETGRESTYIPNGIDSDVFHVEYEIKNRNPFSIAMLYHDKEWKGSSDGLEVIYKLKNEYPKLTVYMFGVPKRPVNLPNWISYTKDASQKQLKRIYNSSAIFICSSWSEGFGLTGAESMACGCALVSTDTEGVREYAVDKVNSLLCQPRDIDNLYLNVKSLIYNDELRIKLAVKGANDIKEYLSLNNSANLFEMALLE